MALDFRRPDLDGQKVDSGAFRPQKISASVQRLVWLDPTLIGGFFRLPKALVWCSEPISAVFWPDTVPAFLSMGTFVPFRSACGICGCASLHLGVVCSFSRAPRLGLTQREADEDSGRVFGFADGGF